MSQSSVESLSRGSNADEPDLSVSYTELDLQSTMDPAFLQDLINKVIWTFKFFPFLSHTMVGISLGTATPSSMWRPIVDALIARGILRTTAVYTRSVYGRSQTLQIIHLANAVYDPKLWNVPEVATPDTTIQS